MATTHQRQLIRHAATAALLNRTVAGARVYPTRQAALRPGDLPAVLVYTLEESVDRDSRASAPRRLDRELQLAVVGVVRLNDEVDDALDALALQVERALDADPTLAATCGDSLLSSTSVTVDEEGDRPVGAIRLVYSVSYDTPVPDAVDQPLDDLSTVDVRTSLGGEQAPADQANDHLTHLET